MDRQYLCTVTPLGERVVHIARYIRPGGNYRTLCGRPHRNDRASSVVELGEDATVALKRCRQCVRLTAQFEEQQT